MAPPISISHVKAVITSLEVPSTSLRLIRLVQRDAITSYGMHWAPIFENILWPVSRTSHQNDALHVARHCLVCARLAARTFDPSMPGLDQLAVAQRAVRRRPLDRRSSLHSHCHEPRACLADLCTPDPHLATPGHLATPIEPTNW